MSIATTTQKVSYAGDGTTDVFAVPFAVLDTANLVVKTVDFTDPEVPVEDTLVLDTDFTFSGDAQEPGSSITLTTAPTANMELYIFCRPTKTQPVSIPVTGPLPVESMEAQLDKLTLMIQDLQEQLSRTVKTKEHVSPFTPDFDVTPGRVGYIFTVSDDGESVELRDPDTYTGAQGPEGPTGPQGPAGASGANGADGVGVPAGGTTGQVLKKNSNTDYDTLWAAEVDAAGLVAAHEADTLGVHGIPDTSDISLKSADETISGEKSFSAPFSGSIANDAATGANQTLGAVNTPIVRLADPGLTSIDEVPAGSAGQFLVLMNATGASVQINDETGSTAANRIRTGSGGAFTMQNNAAVFLIYDGSSSRWRMIGGAGGSKHVGTFSGTSISPQSGSADQTWVYNGGSAQSISSTPVGTLTDLANGTKFTLIGSSDTNTLELSESDVANGMLLNGSMTLYRGSVIVLEYNSTLGRLIEIGRS